MITRRTRCLSLLICMILAATLWGCGKEEPAETVPVTENCWIDIGGSTIDNRVTELNLNNTAYSLDTLLEVSGQLTNVSKIDFADAAFTPDTEVVADGYFHESEFRSAPYFDLQIDGITLLDTAF